MASATMKRLAAMQDCPLLMVRALTAVEIASSRSALGITMKGSLPPSSSTVFLMRSPHCAATERPAGSLPVSVAAATRSSAITPRGLAGADQQRLKRAVREARAPQDIFDRQGALRHVRSVLQQTRRCRPSARARRNGTPARRENSRASPPAPGRSAGSARSCARHSSR